MFNYTELEGDDAVKGQRIVDKPSQKSLFIVSSKYSVQYLSVQEARH